jgi:hypothetical protein
MVVAVLGHGGKAEMVKAEIRGQKSEAGGQNSEGRGRAQSQWSRVHLANTTRSGTGRAHSPPRALAVKGTHVREE